MQWFAISKTLLISYYDTFPHRSVVSLNKRKIVNAPEGFKKFFLKRLFIGRKLILVRACCEFWVLNEELLLKSCLILALLCLS